MSGCEAGSYFCVFFSLVILLLLIYRVWWIQQTRGPELATLATENQFAVLADRCSSRRYF